MLLMRTLPALAALLALLLAGCGDDEPGSGGSAPERDDPRMEQAEAILACTDAEGLPGSIGLIEGGVPAVDLTTETETIVVHVLESEEAASGYQNAGDFDQEVVDNTAILGGAISPEHRTLIVECIESNPISG